MKKRSVIITASVAAALVTTSAGALFINKPQPQVNNTQSSPSTSTVEPTVTPSPTPTTPVASEPPTPSKSVSPTATPAPSPSTAPTPTNPYTKNSMTGYVYDKRVSVGKVVGAWGLPNSWPALAKQAGLVVDHTPQVYDAAYSGNSIWFVESINADGSVTMTSYNTAYDTGLSTHTFPANQIPSFQFIH